jgi:hypothetical protein
MSGAQLRASAVALALILVPGAAVAAAAEGESAVPSKWSIPPEGCAPSGGPPGAPGEEAGPLPFASGDAFGMERLEVLRAFLPQEIWQYRERFFYEGMRLVIGPCFRDYGPPAFFAEATRKLAGRAHLIGGGGLDGYLAGLPFPPDAIDPSDPQAGLRWAWNAAHRYQGAGFRGAFRVTDLLGRIGRAEPFEGSIFKIDLLHRSDLAASDYQVPFARGKQWVAGGRFDKPFDAREYAWRQYRNDSQHTDAARSDDLHAYLPTWRRVRRISASEVEGLYMPSFSVGVVQNQQLVVGGAGGMGGAGVAAAGGTASGGDTLQTKRSGFEGLETRPLLYDYRVLGLRDILAPINAANPMYPSDDEREFGPWGLSFASDRWDLRRALVLEGKVKGKPGARGQSRVVTYLDLQTLVPLYQISFDARDEAIDVGIFAGRWSEDRPDYPRWPDDPARPVRVIDPVAEAFANLGEEGSWRRESWDLVATPPPDSELRNLISVNDLTKGH